MIDKVVVPLDGSSLATHALGPACSLAGATGASVVLVTTHWEDGAGDAREHLEQLAGALRVADVDTVVVHDRTPVEAILLESHDPTAAVCMATHGRSGIGASVLGSVAETVVRESKHPVVLVGPSVDRGWTLTRWGNLLVPVDGSPTSAAIAPVAADWAQMLGLRPEIVQVLPAGKAIVEHPHDVEAAYVRDVASRCTNEDAPSHWRVLHALDPASALVAHAHDLPAALVAMATHGRSGISRVAIGSVAARVIRLSHCPVVVTQSVPPR